MAFRYFISSGTIHLVVYRSKKAFKRLVVGISLFRTWIFMDFIWDKRDSVSDLVLHDIRNFSVRVDAP